MQSYFETDFSFKRRLLLLASFVLATVRPQQVTISSAKVFMNRPQVSQLETVELQLTRSIARNTFTWQTNHCFELYVGSPYSNTAEYIPFPAATPPVCTAITSGVVVECSVTSANVMQFYFSQLEDTAMNRQGISFTFTNFQTPYSSQILSDIELRSYGDRACKIAKNTKKLTAVQIEPAFLPQNAISVSSSVKVIGSRDPSNTLTVSFTPQTTMSPSGKGKIEIGIPSWYEVDGLSELMYNPEALNQCSSSCMNIRSSILQGQYLNILYDDMKAACISGSEITIQCASFYNPIYQDKWYGFYVNTYDNESPFYKAIEKSSSQNFLDTNDYEPHPIPVTGFTATPADNIVNSPSAWEFILNPGLPMIEECYVQIFTPLDLKFEVESFEVEGIFKGMNRVSFIGDQDVDVLPGGEADPRTSIVFQGCYDLTFLGADPFGSLVFQTVYTQRSIKDSDQFDLIIYKDALLAKKIAQLSNGNFVPASILQEGSLSQMALYPLVYQVQQSSLLYVEFQVGSNIYEGAKVTIQLPSDVTLPPEGTILNLFGLTTPSSGAYLSTDATYATVKRSNEIEILDFIMTEVKPAGFQFRFAVEGINNQRSAKDAGGFTITTFDQIDGQFYLIDSTTTKSSFVATPGYIIASGNILIDSPINYRDSSVYTLIFTAPSSIPFNGFMHIRFPPELTIDREKTVSTGVCKRQTCHFIDSHWLQIRFSITTSKDQELSIEIGGIKNPRSFQPTGSFEITTYDNDGVSKIDTGFNMNTQMTIAGTISEFSILRANKTNGARTDYNFTVKTDIPILKDDYLQFIIPSQIKVNYEGFTTECSSTDTIVCGITGREVKIQVLELASPYEFSWTMSNMGNPTSTAPSDSFTEIRFFSKDDFMVSEVKQASSAQVTNTDPANLQSYLLSQKSDQAGADAPYVIFFTPVNALPSTASIKIEYPEQIALSQGNETLCIVTTYSVLDDKCEIDTEARTIIIKDAFALAESYKSEITIKLINVTNPADNRPGQGFTITTYSDADLQYVSDRVTNEMAPQLACDYPCATCAQNDRTNCSSCWAHDLGILPSYLMSYPDVSSGRCENACDFGYTSNGTANLRCTKCDASCNGCEDTGTPGDTKQCVSCSVAAPFRLENTKRCLPQCEEGVFLILGENTCGVCNEPCQTCTGTRDTCTSCEPEKVLSNLHQSTCIETCPAGTISIAGVCEPCFSPCATCYGSQNLCTSCDRSENRDVLFSSSCFDVCPRGYITDKVTRECVGCLPGCDLCMLSNTSHCEVCGDNLVAYKGSCIGSCPDGLRPSKGECVSADSFDLILMYFPFLIASVLVIFLVLAGKLKKKAILVEGEMRRINTQQSIVAINAFIAPLQTLATILMFVLSLFQGRVTVFALTVAVYAAMIIFNWAFLVWFIRNFFQKFAPRPGTMLLVNKKAVLINKRNRFKYEQDRDKEFRVFASKHRVSTFIMFALIGGCHFNTFKLIYSHFYMFDMFKAKWQRATHLRQTLVKWQMAYMCVVHLPLILVCIFGIATIPFAEDQLFIVMWEIIILTLLVIALQIWELIRLKQIFFYTENKIIFAKTKQMQRFERRIKMLNIHEVNKKPDHSSRFNEKKLSELLGLFGSRNCKSAEDLEHGFKKVEDYRREHTWPCSPTLEDEINLLDLKFTAEDAYEVYDNVYAEGVPRPLVRHINIQAGEPGRREFQDALDRKQNEILFSSQLEEPVEELSKMRTARLRGRQNKYYNAIEIEDGTGEQQEDQDATYERLIHQQEEEEQFLKTLVSQEEIDLATARKLRRAEEKQRLKEAQLQAELKLKQERDAKARALFEEKERQRLIAEEQERQRLQAEADRVRQEIEEREAEEQRRKIEESFQERLRYEEAERQRIKAEQIERERLAVIAEQERVERLERERIERQAEEVRLQQERRIEEQKRIDEVRMVQQQQEMLRQQQKLIEKEEADRKLQERLALEEAERQEQQRIEDEARKQRELQKAREQQQRQAERAARELERQERMEQERLQKELRKQQEEIRLKGQHDEKQAERQRQDELRRQEEEKIEIRQAANVYARNLTRQQPLDEPKKVKPSKTLQQQTSVKDIPVPTVQVYLEEEPEPPKMQQTQRLETQKLKSQDPPAHMLRTTMSNMSDQMNTTTVAVNENWKKSWNRNKERSCVQCPPNPDSRIFNEHDVLGHVDRDEKANVIVLEDHDGQKHDKSGEPTNQRGFLINPNSGDVIENMSGQVMFKRADIDFKGELPAPFNIEKYNFNPHLISGDFDYTQGKPLILKTAKGALVDKQGRRVNEHGWYVMQGNQDIVDNMQRKKFDRRQLVGNGDLPKLYNYEGKRFCIRDVMGEFEKDSQGHIIPIPAKDGTTNVDLLGRLVNQKGYLTDGYGNIIDCRGRQIWKLSDLKSGEFIKIFPFTKFNISNVLGDIQVSRDGEPILTKTPEYEFTDRRGRLVNTRGYLVDRQGNVIDQNGKIQFDSAVISTDGEIPKVFRTGVLHQDTDSSISRLMSEIEKEAHNTADVERDSQVFGGQFAPHEKKDDTSVDSKMDDTPANYNIANQRYEFEFVEEGDVPRRSLPDDLYDDELDLGDSDYSDGASGMNPAVLIPRKKTRGAKKNKKQKTIEILPPTEKQKNMAGAYGGEPKPEIRRPKVKYDKDRLKGGKKFRVTTAEEPRAKATLTGLGKSGSSAFDAPEPRKQGLMMRESGHRQKKSTIQVQDEPDFEQVYGKDIDQFLDDSEWDIDQMALEKQSSDDVQHRVRGDLGLASHGDLLNETPQTSGRKGKKKKSPSRLSGGASPLVADTSAKRLQQQRQVVGPPRETILNVTDDPGVLHRGEILEFETRLK